MVVILDPRTKPYGKMFLASLPNCRQVVEETILTQRRKARRRIGQFDFGSLVLLFLPFAFA